MARLRLAAPLLSHQHRATHSLLGDQPTVKPLPDAPFADPGFVRDSRYALGRSIPPKIGRPTTGPLAQGRDRVLSRDPLRVGTRRLPQPMAHHLELYRLDARA